MAEDQEEHKQRRPQKKETQSQVSFWFSPEALSVSPLEPWTHIQLFQLGLFLLHTPFTVIRLQLLYSSLLRSVIRLLVAAVALADLLFQV